MKHETHTQHIMKDTDSFYIRICNCGVVHLCFGATTLNLTEHAVVAVTETLKEVTADLLLRRQRENSHSDSALTGEEGKVIRGNFSPQAELATTPSS